MEEKLLTKTDEKIKEILDEDINPNNLDYLYKLSKIRHYAKEDKEMYGNYGRGNYGRENYGNYGRNNYGEYGNYGAYGNYGENYGRRGYDAKYRGDDELDRMAGEYGRYMESRNRYGAENPDTKKSLKYMLESMENFARMLKEEAQSQEEVEMIRQTAQRIAQM